MSGGCKVKVEPEDEDGIARLARFLVCRNGWFGRSEA